MRFRRISTLVFMGALSAAACGGGNPGTTSGGSVASPGVQQNIASQVPAAIKSKGSVSVATDATYAPNEFVDPSSRQIKGWDVDLGNALGSVMGVKFSFNNADFNSIIPALGSRYDLGISSFSPTAEREKTVDFVTYYKAGESFITKKGGASVNSLADLCGKTVAVETGTTEESDAYAYVGKKPDGSPLAGGTNFCKKAGKPDITVHSFTKQTQANTEVTSGKADAGFADQPVAAYQAKLNSQLQLSGKACSVAPYGIALPKNSGLAKPLQAAVKYLIDSGTYDKILNSWGVDSGAIKSSDVGMNINSIAGEPSCVPS